MKKVFILVALFLGGMTTQAFSNTIQNENLVNNPTMEHWKYQSISFVENGVLYTVFVNGKFTYEMLQPIYANRGRSNQTIKVNYSRTGSSTRTINNFRILKDRQGRIVSLGGTEVTYLRNGRVNTIGSVPMYYERGKLSQVGGLTLSYNRKGELMQTYGYVNNYNQQDWHSNWITYSNDIYYDYGTDRIRTK